MNTPFKTGVNVKGEYKGQPFTGVLRDLNGISTITRDRPVLDEFGRYSATIYMDFDHTTGKAKNGYVEALPDVIDSEIVDLPLSEIARDHLLHEYRLSFEAYRETWIREHTAYTTKTVKTTCEYGHTHMVKQCVAVLPEIDEIALHFGYFLACLNLYAQYTAQCAYVQKNETWSRLAGKLSLGGGTFMNRSMSDYQGLDRESVKRIEASMHAEYERLCDAYVVKIYGTGTLLDKYLRSEHLISGTNRRARLIARGLIEG